MKAYHVSKKATNTTLEEKIKLLETCDVEELLYIKRETEDYPHDYDKEIVIAVINNLFAKGITCL